MGDYSEWIVELDGREIGRLVNPRFEDMFWELYDLESDDGYSPELHDPELWKECRFKFKEPDTGEYCESGFSAITCADDLERSRIRMRGLYTASTRRAAELQHRIEKNGHWIILAATAIVVAASILYLVFFAS